LVTTADCDALVIGAGPAGLAVGACLRAAGLGPAIIERGNRVAPVWSQHYDRLHLHTVKEYSGLPYFAFAPEYPKFPSRVDVIRYLETYAAHNQLAPHFGEEAHRLYQQGGVWHCETSASHYTARNVVIATGYNRVPNVPRWPDEDDFQGDVVHSFSYRNGAEYRDARVLIVGIGNTGAEIALDLLEHGAHPTISVRGTVNVIPREFRGRSTQATGVKLRWLPTGIRDRIASAISRAAFGDLAQYGLKRPAYGPVRQIEQYGRLPVIDVGTLAAIRDGRIAIAPDIARFTETGVIYTDGRAAAFDAVILATGYRPGIDAFLQDATRVIDERGYPAGDGESPLRGLFFVGFARPKAGVLREINISAQAVARQIAGRERALAASGVA
jgi:indole-3-pyruvate monooxygenase